MPKLIENNQSYTEVFRMLATKHLQLNHLKNGPEDVHFVRCILSKHPMLSQADLSEFLKGLRNRIKFPAMVLVAYSSTYDQHHHDAKKKNIEGEFFILDRHSRDNWDQLESVLNVTEQIGQDILAYLIDYYDEHPEDGRFMHSLGLNEKIANTETDTLAGTKFYFTIELPNQVRLTFDSAKFDDLTIE